jgi:hypothetical protein
MAGRIVFFGMHSTRARKSRGVCVVKIVRREKKTSERFFCAWEEATFFSDERAAKGTIVRRRSR